MSIFHMQEIQFSYWLYEGRAAQDWTKNWCRIGCPTMPQYWKNDTVSYKSNHTECMKLKKTRKMKKLRTKIHFRGTEILNAVASLEGGFSLSPLPEFVVSKKRKERIIDQIWNGLFCSNVLILTYLFSIVTSVMSNQRDFIFVYHSWNFFWPSVSYLEFF